MALLNRTPFRSVYLRDNHGYRRKAPMKIAVRSARFELRIFLRRFFFRRDGRLKMVRENRNCLLDWPRGCEVDEQTAVVRKEGRVCFCRLGELVNIMSQIKLLLK